MMNQNLTALLIFTAFIISKFHFAQADEQQSTSAQIESVYIKWENRGSHTYFNLTTPLGNGLDVNSDNVWIGVGLNTEPRMKGADVVVCKKSDNLNAVQHYFNDPDQYMSNLFDADQPMLGISKASVSVHEGNLTCSFRRKNRNSDVDNYFNVSPAKRAYLLIAYGQLNDDGELQAHSFKQIYSEGQIGFPFMKKAHSRYQSALRKHHHHHHHHHQHQQQSYVNGAFSLKWTTRNNQTDFVYQVNISGPSVNIYAAVGFSNDKSMGDDDVCVCVYSAQLQDVFHFYNEGKHSAPINSTNLRVGLSDSAVKFNANNNTLTCTFSRQNKLDNQNLYFDLSGGSASSSYYILTVSGLTSESGSIIKHNNRAISSEKIKFSQ